MPTIAISVTDKRAVVSGTPVIICGNSDYSITWTLDSEWTSLTDRVAHFEFWNDNGLREAKDVSFTGDSVTVPVLNNIDRVFIMLYAGDIHTSSPVCIPCIRTVTKKEEVPPSPPSPTPLIGGIYGNIEADSSTQDWSESEEYAIATQADLEAAKAWIEAHCPAELGVTVDIGSYTVVGSLAMRCSFGSSFFVQPDAVYKNIRAGNSHQSTAAFGSVNGTNYFKCYATSKHLILVSGVKTSSSWIPYCWCVVAMDKDGHVGSVLSYREDNESRTTLSTICEGTDDVVISYSMTAWSPMTLIYNAPAPQASGDDPSIFETVFVTPTREESNAYAGSIGQAKLNDIVYLQVNKCILLTL